MRWRLNSSAAVKRATRREHERNKFDGKDRLLGLLHVLIVGERQAFELQRDGLRGAVDASDLGADELGEVGIFLLRHGAGAGGEGLGQGDEIELRGGEERDLFGETAEVKADEGEGLQVLENEIAVAGGVDGVGCGGCEAEFVRGNVAVERKCCAGHCTGAERAEVEPIRALRSRATSRRIIST